MELEAKYPYKIGRFCLTFGLIFDIIQSKLTESYFQNAIKFLFMKLLEALLNESFRFWILCLVFSVIIAAAPFFVSDGKGDLSAFVVVFCTSITGLSIYILYKKRQLQKNPIHKI